MSRLVLGRILDRSVSRGSKKDAHTGKRMAYLAYLGNIPAHESHYFVDLIMAPFACKELPAVNKQLGFLNLMRDLSKSARHHVREHQPRLVGLLMRLLRNSGATAIEAAETDHTKSQIKSVHATALANFGLLLELFPDADHTTTVREFLKAAAVDIANLSNTTASHRQHVVTILNTMARNEQLVVLLTEADAMPGITVCITADVRYTPFT